MKEELNSALMAAIKNDFRYNIFFNMLSNIAMTNIGWKNMPEEIDTRYVEKTLFTDGSVLFFKDLVYLCLKYMPDGLLNVYDNPTKFTVNTASGYYNNDLNIKNSVPIYANMTRTSELATVDYYAVELTKICKYIDINLDNCSTTAMLSIPQEMEFSVKNAIKKKKLGEPIIIGRKDFQQIEWDLFGLEAQKHFVADKQIAIFEKKWNECLTYLGVPNLTVQKRERVLQDEVMRSQGGTIASRNARLLARKQGAEQVNRMFGLNIQPYFIDMQDNGGDVSEQLYNAT